MPFCFRSACRTIGGLTLILSSAILAQAAPPTGVAPATAPKPPATAPAAPNAPVDPVSDLVGQAIAKMNTNDVDGALAKLTDAIKLGPKNSGPYILRASIYYQKKQFPLAEQDFKAGLALDPTNKLIRINLAEVRFMQKHFDLARPDYLALAKDPDGGDMASYSVFLCDLYGGHEDLAAQELKAFNDKGSDGSYYFGNAAWSLYHKNIEDARQWLVSASNIFSPRKNAFYAEPLRVMGYLPLPQPTAK